jgi:hypothetical protein
MGEGGRRVAHCEGRGDFGEELHDVHFSYQRSATKLVDVVMFWSRTRYLVDSGLAGLRLVLAFGRHDEVF